MFTAKLGNFFQKHGQLLYQTTSPIQRYTIPNASVHYIFILLIFAFHFYQGLVVPIFERYPIGGNLFQHIIHNFSTTDRIFTHQVVPYSFRQTIDMCFLFADGAPILGYITFIYITPIKEKFQLIISANNRLYIGKYAFTRTLSTKWLHFNRKLIPKLLAFIIIYSLDYDLYFLFNVYINGYYNLHNFIEIFYWLVIFQVQMFYICHAYFSVLTNLILASIYLNSFQELIRDRFVRLNSKLMTKTNKQIPIRAFYFAFLQGNYPISFISEAIQEYQRFASPFINIYFAAIMGLATYLLVGVLFTNISVIEKNVLVVATIGCNLFLFTCTYFAAKVVKGNGQITKQIKIFCYNFSMQAKVFNRELIKMETLQDSFRLKPFAFRMVGNFRITSKTFYFVFSYTTTLFLFIYKENYSKKM